MATPASGTSVVKNPEFFALEFISGQWSSEFLTPASLSEDLKQELLDLLKAQGLVEPTATLGSFSKVNSTQVCGMCSCLRYVSFNYYLFTAVKVGNMTAINQRWHSFWPELLTTLKHKFHYHLIALEHKTMYFELRT
jgi:hypothetical protein